MIVSCSAPSPPEETIDNECGSVECSGSVYDCGDLAVLQEFINLNPPIYKHYLDNNVNGCLEPLEFGDQVWKDGRLVNLNLSYNQEAIIDPNNPSQLDNINYRLTKFPDDFGNLSALEILKLNDNEFISLPESFTDLTKLKHLELENNLLTELPVDLGNLINLEQLVINYNLITHLPGSITLLTSLNFLWAHHNPLKTLPENIGNMSQLQWLYLNNDSLKYIPASIGNLENLDILNIEYNLLPNLPNTLCNIFPCETDGAGHCITGMEIFSVNNNFFCSGSIPDCISNNMDLGTQTCTDCPPHFMMVENSCVYEPDYLILQNFIDLNPESYLAGKTVEQCDNPLWWDNGRLVEITFLHKELSSSIPANFGRLEKLKILQLTDNNLTGEFPDSLMYLTNLRILKLNVNDLSGPIPVNIDLLWQLDTLNLDKNNFSGGIPSSITNIEELKYLNLNYNDLNGFIPNNIGNLTQMRYLRLDNNNLSGEIPTSIGNMINMKRLYLLNNNLSGSIPQSICNIDSLRSYLDNNQLCPGADGYPDCLPQDYIGFQYGCEE